MNNVEDLPKHGSWLLDTSFPISNECHEKMKAKCAGILQKINNQQAATAVTEKVMSVEVRIVPMERYQVTRKSIDGVETVAENLMLAQAENIAGAIQDRAANAGKAVLPIVELPVKE